jgi:uncharacterized protein YjbI with pentapeptide repeats
LFDEFKALPGARLEGASFFKAALDGADLAGLIWTKLNS